MSGTRPGGGRRPACGSPWRPGPATAGGPWAAGAPTPTAACPGWAAAKPRPPARTALTFAPGDGFRAEGLTGFPPQVTVVCRIDDPGAHYHVPLLLSPYGYSTYR